MKLNRNFAVLAIVACAALFTAGAYAMGVDVQAVMASHSDVIGAAAFLPFAGEIKIDELKDMLKGQLQDVTRDLREGQTEMKKVVDGALEEIKAFKTITGESNDKLTKLSESAQKSQADMLELQQKMEKLQREGVKRAPDAKSIGQIVIESQEFKDAGAAGGKPEMKAVVVGSLKTAIVNATQNTLQPLVRPDHAGIVMPAMQQLSVRDLLPTYRTESNVVTFTTENVFTNNAAIQYSSPDYENVTKPEGGITFTLNEAPVRTIAQFIPASRQVLSDAKMLQSYIEGRLMYSIKLEEEDEILNGDGTAGHLNGLVAQAQPYAPGTYGGVSSDTKLDQLLRAITQTVVGSYFNPDGVLMHPTQWMKLQLEKDTTGRYLFGNPYEMVAPRVWGVRVVPTLSLSGTKFLVGAFQAGAGLWDREDASIRIAEQHDDFFVKNMVAILAEERLALTVFRPTAFVKGNFL